MAPLVKPTLPASHWQTRPAGRHARRPRLAGLSQRQLLRLQAQALADNPSWQAALSRVAQARQPGGGGRRPPAAAEPQRQPRQQPDPPARSRSKTLKTGRPAPAVAEVDLWGRLAAGSRSAQTSAEASEYAAASTRLLLETDVASGYFRLSCWTSACG